MLDDFVLSAFALNVLLNWVDPKVVKAHWFGEEDLLTTIQKGLKNAEVLMPDAIMKKIEAWIGKYMEKALVPVVSRSFVTRCRNGSKEIQSEEKQPHEEKRISL